MFLNAFRGASPWCQLIMTVFVALASFLLLFFLSVIAAIPVVGFDQMIATLSGVKRSYPSSISILKYLQMVQSVGLFVLPPFIVGWLFEGNAQEYLRLTKKIKPATIIIAILSILVFSPFISYIGELNSKMSLPDFLGGIENWMRHMEDNADALIKRFMEVNSISGLLFNLLMIAVIPAAGEEFLFRGVFQKIFTSMTRNYHLGIWISAFIFSAMHMQFYGFIPRMLLGAMFGYMLVYTGSLWAPVLCHFINNALGVLSFYAEHNGQNQLGKLADFGEQFADMWPVALASLALTIWLLTLLKKNGNQTREGMNRPM